jgi:steroid 5-alpha reductase family enzyme
VDRFWGLAFVLQAWWYAAPDLPGDWPAGALLALVTIWGVRLSFHITRRNWGKGEDYRYVEMRTRHGGRFPIVSLGTVFLLQAALAWLIGMPLYAGLADGDGTVRHGVASVGVVVWIVGFVFETVGDRQLERHRADPSRRGAVLATGLWRYTRHPNYFGDAAVWWGLWMIAAARGGWWTVFAPVLMTVFLLRVSGVTLLERRLRESRPGYREYAERTSSFFPWPPRR